ncbi:MAG TPA: PepSY-associated TM helix domain-containing protein [Gemmataceae bacterium]|nr:PepSY-associated TM helix domain-containing protein [Gemmataceae bacterium]
MTFAHRFVLKWARTIHVYLTLFGLALLLFFAITGFMLNHENWFLPTQTTSGILPPEMLATPDQDAVVETLRAEFGVPPEMEVRSFDADAQAIRVRFQSDKGTADAEIQKADGATVVNVDTPSQTRVRYTVVEGKMPIELLDPDDPAKALPIVEVLRRDFGARGEVIVAPRYEKESESFSVLFKAPSYSAEATIKATDGSTKVKHESRGINGILLDLHRGKDSGPHWSLVVDITAGFFVVVSITGIILWSSLKGRAQHGLAILILGTVLSVAVYFLWVPR